MKWFKFYGQDFLTDTKLIGIDPLLKTVWVTLLCMVDEGGEIDYLKETDLQRLANCDDNQLNDVTDFDRTKGCLEFFQERGMIALQTVTDSNADRNGGVTHHVTVLNYRKRQGQNLSNAERQKKYRETHKTASKIVKKVSNDSNAKQSNDSNARIDKNRIDKNRIDNINTDLADASVATQAFGNPDINLLLEEFKRIFNLPMLDGSQKENRKYANLLIKKMGSVEKAIDLARLGAEDDWYKNNLTSIKNLYYSAVKLVARKRGDRPIVAVMKKEGIN